MRTTERIFTRAERKTAMWALLLASLTAATGLLIEQTLIQPSLGPDGAQSFVFAAAPGVVDAQPAADVVNRFNTAL